MSSFPRIRLPTFASAITYGSCPSLVRPCAASCAQIAISTYSWSSIPTTYRACPSFPCKRSFRRFSDERLISTLRTSSAATSATRCSQRHRSSMSADDLRRLRHMLDAGRKILRMVQDKSRADLDTDETLAPALMRSSGKLRSLSRRSFATRIPRSPGRTSPARGIG